MLSIGAEGVLEVRVHHLAAVDVGSHSITRIYEDDQPGFNDQKKVNTN
jgi:hypothetical protein